MPRVSGLIPCYHERHRIRRCLESLLESDHLEESIERVVIEELARAHSNLRLIDGPERHEPQGSNLGIRATDSDVVVRADAHAWYPPDHVIDLVRSFHGTR